MVFGLVTPQDGLVTPQYGELRPTSLRNVQNLQKSLKSHQNSIEITFDALKDGLVTFPVWPSYGRPH